MSLARAAGTGPEAPPERQPAGHGRPPQGIEHAAGTTPVGALPDHAGPELAGAVRRGH